MAWNRPRDRTPIQRYKKGDLTRAQARLSELRRKERDEPDTALLAARIIHAGLRRNTHRVHR
jgi:hypothetical protein